MSLRPFEKPGVLAETEFILPAGQVIRYTLRTGKG